MNEEKLEKEILDKELTAPRITPALIDASIKSEEYHVFNDSKTTICLLELKNGHKVEGASFCVSPENFDEEIGRDIARGNARDKIWPLLGFLLADLLVSDEISEMIMEANNIGDLN